MKKNVYAIALAFLGLGSFSAQAQDQRLIKADKDLAPAGRSCATMEVLEAQMAADPSLAQRMANVERQTAEVLANPIANRATAGVVTIPVVVHVLYNTSAQNVSDAMITAQLDVLNKDFSKTNADASLTRLCLPAWPPIPTCNLCWPSGLPPVLLPPALCASKRK
ncbi:hypothetical protein [Hymenobacter cellulosilyticus]|uniref:TolC family protein n=1 Tax=Hymenobacter cellulosilyticus TaxID=2932248 RepID=A0A8T9QB47_9BACT|nr:hypothetical protein [Hymenobacter cellulosilyticus]UOQ72749.1 hypothetical protein MUN79_01785 [Hymenobacter cellulosilyticus]